MKKQHPIYSLLLLGIVCLLSACTKSAEIIDDNYPPPLIYWTGSGEQLKVPATGYRNYVIDTVNRKVYISLGIARSGLEDGARFDVELIPDPDTINSLIQSGGLQNTIPLPPDAYAL